MTPDANELLVEALKLPSEARAALAGSLIETLEDEVDEGWEEAWSVELARRLAELDARTVKTGPWHEARKLILGGG